MILQETISDLAINPLLLLPGTKNSNEMCNKKNFLITDYVVINYERNLLTGKSYK